MTADPLDRIAYACAAARLTMHNDVRVVPEREIVAIRAALKELEPVMEQWNRRGLP